MGDGPNDAGLSRTHLGRALDASLRRLGVDVIDLYQAHAWDPLTPIEETLGFFADAVRAGKIRYAGVSNFVGWQLQKAALLADDAAPIVTLQPQYNLLVRDIELEIVDVCRNEGGPRPLPWSPLAGGWLPGSTPATRCRAPPVSARTRTAAWRRTARERPGGPLLVKQQFVLIAATECRPAWLFVRRVRIHAARRFSVLNRC